MTSRAARYLDRLWHEYPAVFRAVRNMAEKRGTTMLALVAEKADHWERLLKMHETEEES